MPNKYLAIPLSFALFISSGPGLAYAANSQQSPGSSTSASHTESDTSEPDLKGDVSAESAYQKAMDFNQKGDIGSALLELIKAVNTDPTMVKAYYQQAIIFQKQKLLKLASSRLEQALAIQPDYSEARVLLAQISIEQGNFSKAIVHLGKSMEKPTTEKVVTTGNATESKEKKRNFWFKKKSKKAKGYPKSRSKIRQAIAKKYKKFHLAYRSPRHNNRPWYSKYTKLFGWANLFKENKNQTAHKIMRSEDHFDLQKKPEQTIASNPAPPWSEKAATKKPRPISKEEDRALDRIFAQSEVTANDLVAPILNVESYVAQSSAPEHPIDTTSNTTPTDEKKVESVDSEKNTRKIVLEKPKDKRIIKSVFLKEGTPQLAALPDVDSITGVAEEEDEEVRKKFEPPIKDKWTEKLTYLAKNGTGSLKRGEAFMFSEDTGEAVLFLQDGRRIRRIVAPKQSSERVVKLRRPDVLVPKELFYDLALLGKVVGKKAEETPPKRTVARRTTTTTTTTNQTQPPTFHMEKLMDDSRSFVGAVRSYLRL